MPWHPGKGRGWDGGEIVAEPKRKSFLRNFKWPAINMYCGPSEMMLHFRKINK